MVTGVEQTKEMSSSVEKQADSRKNNKPIMEKRRRARINNCLNELKLLILDAMKKDPASHSKLEKADILEMTVKHLGGLQSSGFPDRFRSGYRHCLSEVARFPGLEPELRARLLRHLEELMPGARQLRPPAAPTPPSDTEDAPSSTLITADSKTLRLLPTRLSNGDLALLLATNDQAFPARFQSDTKWYLPPANSHVPLVPQSNGASALEGPALTVPPGIEPFTPANFDISIPGVCAKALDASNLVLLRDRPRLSPQNSGLGTPTPAACPLALVTKTDGRPWRPW